MTHPILSDIQPADLLADLGRIEFGRPGALAVISWALTPQNHARILELIQEQDQPVPPVIETFLSRGAQVAP